MVLAPASKGKGLGFPLPLSYVTCYLCLPLCPSGTVGTLSVR